MTDRVEQELTEARRRLLDLTARNRLLNFKPAKRSSVHVVDELPSQVWQLLVEQEKSLSFLAREEHELFEERPSGPASPSPADTPNTGEPVAGEASAPPAEEPAEGVFALPDLKTALETPGAPLPARYADAFLQTDLSGQDLQTNLLRIEQAAESAMEEQGVNFLFLALGFLEWRPLEDAEQAYRAPVLLVPVRLERTSARKRYKLTALDEEPVLNPCLAAKCLSDFHVTVPPLPESREGWDVDGYLEQVRSAVAGQPGWRVLGEIHLGLFSFTKYLMYLDLDPTRWPAEMPLAGNALLRALCGDPSGLARDAFVLPPLPEEAAVDPEAVFQVHDADSSQQRAILAAKAGASLVIKGPPGTGKSQTITNIIAECLAAGKTVLFVSEKMAALEVVKRRLEAVGLGDFCLELHSTKSNRRAVLGQLERAWNRGHGAAHDGQQARQLTALRGRLNAYVQALHAPFGPGGLTPYQAIGRFVLLAGVPDAPAAMPGHEAWDPPAYQVLHEQIEQFARQLEAVFPPAEHAWRGAALTRCTGQVQQALRETLVRLQASLAAATAAGSQAAAALGTGAPANLEALATVLASARLVLSAPLLPARLLQEPLWDALPPALQALLGDAKAFVETRQWASGKYSAESLDAVDWGGMFQRCNAYWASIGRFFRPAYWADRKALQAARTPGYRPPFADLVADLKRLAQMQALKDKLNAAGELGYLYFDRHWAGAASNWADLIRLANWLGAFRKALHAGAIGPAGADLAQEGTDRSALQQPADSLDQALAQWHNDWAALAQTVSLKEPGAFDCPTAAAPLDQLADRLEQMTAGLETLFDWSRYQEALQGLAAGPLAPFVAAATAAGLDAQVLPLAMEKQYLRLLVEDVLADREVLRNFSGANHEADRLGFARLDRQWMQQTGGRLTAKLAAERPPLNRQAAPSSPVGTLLGEMNRKRGGKSIRRLIRDAGEAILKLSPCFMMSPLSVAQFIDPTGIRFDVVVFDEASQVEPADALGAVARGAQLILVGDPEQLPPTNFFHAMGGAGDSPDDGAAALTDMESILDRGLAVLPALSLRWHYRSRHESLIAFSNAQFYDNELVVFPSCHANTEHLGLRMLYEPSDAYDRGRGQTNRPQARRIAQAVLEHARTQPGRSLGVGAFSVAQQQAILDELERLRREDDSLEPFFDRNKPDPFFVKNLETIQGDERDVILLSVGYGKAAPADRLSMNFGPLNQANGFRRLNVLITRARQRCLVFSSIRAEDFDLAATAAPGVTALHGYLDYALSGRLAAHAASDRDFDSPFEQAVYNALTETGLQIHRQVGCAGYSIDLAVVDPAQPGRYLLGIECDGAMYRSCATARDRDRLRQQVLEDLGWRIHRIWSTDWFRTPRREIDRLNETLRQAKAGTLAAAMTFPPDGCPASDASSPRQKHAGETPAGHVENSPAGTAEDAPAGSAPAVPTVPYARFAVTKMRSGEKFYTDSLDTLAGVLLQIVAFEGPIHRDLLARRLIGVYGLARAGSAIKDRFEKALALALGGKPLRRTDEFLWPAAMQAPPLRRRDDEEDRDIDLICPEEIVLAAHALLKSQLGMSRADLVVQTARLLGFAAAGPRITARIDDLLAAELASGRLAANGDGNLKA